MGSSGVLGTHNSALAEKPCIVIGRKGSAGSVYWCAEPCWPVDTVYFAYVPDEISPQFLYHQLKHLRLRKLYSSTAVPSLLRQDLAAVRVAIPPREEQLRIVAEIEEQFTRLDCATKYLAQAGARLKRLADAAVASEFGPDFPRRRMGEICDVKGGIQKQPSRRPVANSYPFLRVANVLRGALALADIHMIELFPGELERLRLRENDLLIVEGNGSPNEIGRMAVWDASIDPCVHQNHLIRARARGEVLADFIAAFWNSPSGRRSVASVASSTSGLHTLSVRKIQSVLVPVPPIAVQHAIIKRIQRSTSFTDRASEDCQSLSERAKRLREAILNKAFAGKLVPQDHSDEPAAVFLETIRAARAQTPARRPAEQPKANALRYANE